MAKKFNITGTCIPGRHYMADTSGKLKQVMALVEEGDYFIINRPRQYGKTTTLLLLYHQLIRSGEYLPFNISFEGVGDKVFEDESSFCDMFLDLLKTRSEQQGWNSLTSLLVNKKETSSSLRELSRIISRLADVAGKKLVLLIDEVDKSSNNQLFVSFLGLLRNKYLDQQAGMDKSFYSVVLAGVHDVKTLKLKIRPDEERKFNSPWNIAAPFEVDMNLHPHEILPMLEDYCAERGVIMDAKVMAERLFYFTSGYPFLVSALCKILDEKILPDKGVSEWTEEDLVKAANILIRESGVANFDSLIANLENYPDLYDTVFRVVIQSEQLEYNPDNPNVALGALFGIFTRSSSGSIVIHNRIYSERIANYMVSKLKTSSPGIGNWDIGAYNFKSQFVQPGNRLDMSTILLRFQAFMREQFSEKDRDFLERNGRLIFLAFLKPIINGGGWDFKEPQISEEKRMDVVVTYFQHRYVIELKIWRGEASHKEGLNQLADYLDRQHLSEGYLLIFDRSKTKTWENKHLEAKGKKIFAVWV